jgi:hypothetical protein
MTRLALLAVLLMAFAPSVGRLLGSASTQVLDGWSQLCTTTGLKWVDTGKASLADKAVPAPGGKPMGPDCDYCRLADLLTVALLFVCLGIAAQRAGSDPLPAVPRLRLRQNRRGLGGQGPPLFA